MSPCQATEEQAVGAEDSVSQLAALRGEQWEPRIPVYPNDHQEAVKEGPERAWVAVRSNAAPIPGEWKHLLDHEFARNGTLNPKERNLADDQEEARNVIDHPEYEAVVTFLLEQAKSAAGDNGSTRNPLPADSAQFIYSATE